MFVFAIALLCVRVHSISQNKGRQDTAEQLFQRTAEVSSAGSLTAKVSKGVSTRVQESDDQDRAALTSDGTFQTTNAEYTTPGPVAGSIGAAHQQSSLVAGTSGTEVSFSETKKDLNQSKEESQPIDDPLQEFQPIVDFVAQLELKDDRTEDEIKELTAWQAQLAQWHCGNCVELPEFNPDTSERYWSVLTTQERTQWPQRIRPDLLASAKSKDDQKAIMNFRGPFFFLSNTFCPYMFDPKRVSSWGNPGLAARQSGIIDFEDGDIVYPSSEHFFQAAKNTNKDIRKVFSKVMNPKKTAARGLGGRKGLKLEELKRELSADFLAEFESNLEKKLYGDKILISDTPDSPQFFVANQKGVNMRSEWDSKAESAMEYALRHKFNNNDLREALKATGNRYLAEGNLFSDPIWGVALIEGYIFGINRLGRLLMKIRDEINADGFTTLISPDKLEKLKSTFAVL